MDNESFIATPYGSIEASNPMFNCIYAMYNSSVAFDSIIAEGYMAATDLQRAKLMAAFPELFEKYTGIL